MRLFLRETLATSYQRSSALHKHQVQEKLSSQYLYTKQLFVLIAEINDSSLEPFNHPKITAYNRETTTLQSNLLDVPKFDQVNRARNNGRSTDNVRTDLGLDQSTYRLAGHVDRSHLIVLKMK